MTPLVLIRHGPTEWNAQGRIQGHSDQPLSAAGRRAVESWRLPPDIAGPGSLDPGSPDWDWVTSPLRRATETLALLRGDAAEPPARAEPALREMHWGAWEGRRLAELREEDGAVMVAAEARGLDFRPPGGESPRDVQARLRPLLAAWGKAARPVAAITHKGVIRAVYALASGWDMTGRPAEKLNNACAHRFLLDADGAPQCARLNIPLTP